MESRIDVLQVNSFCKLSVSICFRVQSLVWIAIDRFVAVVNVFPIKLGLVSSKIRNIAIVSTWILEGVVYFPSLVISGLVERGNNALCSLDSKQSIFPNKEAREGYCWLHVTTRFIAPLFLITACILR